jgi:hypothetical protein
MDISAAFQDATRAEQILAKLDAAILKNPQFEQEAQYIADELETLVRDFHTSLADILADSRKLSAKMARHVGRERRARASA